MHVDTEFVVSPIGSVIIIQTRVKSIPLTVL